MPILKKSNNRSHEDKPKAFVTGINGFVGSHLAELLLSEGYSVFGLSVNRDLAHLSTVESRVSIAYGDIRDGKVVKDVLAEVKPDYIYHLAGSAFVPDADADPRLVYEVNVLGTLNLLETVRSGRLSPRILIVGSGEVYGPVPEERLPVNEDFPLNPTSPYGVTKACADLLASQYAASYQMDVVRVRPFNHIGPRQSEQFVCSSFAKQIVEIEKGLRKPVLEVGNLEARRDFTDVRDVVKAYRTVVEKAHRGEVYNVGSGRAWKIADLVTLLIGQSAVKKIEIRHEQVRVRPNDLQVMLCDPSKLQKQLGWKPMIPIERTLRDLLEYWRKTP
ncbi:MAG TPA: GDP-mannose 4,6-dehydratase [Nitrospiria bacterium]|nr:GDP-mannose 4,6-dehydratase [Nitrospiria bacterium]